MGIVLLSLGDKLPNSFVTLAYDMCNANIMKRIDMNEALSRYDELLRSLN